MNIALVEPEIPQNTGNIVRLCAATGSTLHLVRPLGFHTDDKSLKRAGLDYWHLVEVKYYDSFAELRSSFPSNEFYYATTKGKKDHTQVKYAKDCFIVFGKESAGLPKDLLAQNEEFCVRVPMVPETSARSLNLANSVSIILYEALRQHNFEGLY